MKVEPRVQLAPFLGRRRLQHRNARQERGRMHNYVLVLISSRRYQAYQNKLRFGVF